MKIFTRLALCLAAGSLLLAGCGKDGKDGKDGTSVSNGTVSAASLTADQWSTLAPTGQVLSVAINSPPVVKFKLTDANGAAITGLSANMVQRTTGNTLDAIPYNGNVSFSLAKLVPGKDGAPSKWVNYIVTSRPSFKSATDNTIVPATATRPTTDNEGTLKENSDGTYEYTFYRDITKVKEQIAAMTLTAPNVAADLGDLTYDPNAVHRVTIQFSGNQYGTGSNTANGVTTTPAVAMQNPLNLVYDFIPATGKAVTTANTQREIALTAQCNECHSKLAIHGGGRVEVRYCVVCHTDQRKFGYAEVDGANINTRRLNGFAIGDFPNMIHKYHMGHNLSKTYTGTYAFSEIGYPQDVRNCAKCHTKSDKAPQGDNWKTEPSRLACGACHDGIKWSDNNGTVKHIGGIQADDKSCKLCHADASLIHARTGSKLTFEITDATIVSGKAVVKFKMNLDGITQLKPFTTQTKTAAVGYNGAATTAYGIGTLVDGYGPETRTDSRGAAQYPTIRVDYAVAQDGITNPDDFNANVSARLDQLWDGSAGTLTYDSASGVYTATIAAAPAFPATGTKMATAKIVGYGTFTKSGDTKGGIQFQNVSKAVTGTGFVARRTIVSNDACNVCHEKLASKPNFHSGMRNDAPTCAGCHNPNLENSGWSVNASTFIHAIHGRDKRSVPYRWEDIVWTELTYPGKLKNCQQCHVAGSYDFSNTANMNAAVNGRLLYSTAASNQYSGTGAKPAGYPYILSTNINRPQNPAGTTIYITADTVDYGLEGGLNDAGKTNLVHSPISAACFSCHDSAQAMVHMRQNGGSIYAVRSTAIATSETCLVCHGSGKVGDIKAVHAK